MQTLYVKLTLAGADKVVLCYGGGRACNQAQHTLPLVAISDLLQQSHAGLRFGLIRGEAIHTRTGLSHPSHSIFAAANGRV